MNFHKCNYVAKGDGNYDKLMQEFMHSKNALTRDFELKCWAWNVDVDNTWFYAILMVFHTTGIRIR